MKWQQNGANYSVSTKRLSKYTTHTELRTTSAAFGATQRSNSGNLCDVMKCTSMNFLRAFYYIHDYDKVQHYILYFRDCCDMPSVHFKSLFFINTGKFDAAEQEINNGFNKLIENRQIYDGNDTNRAE